MTLTPNREIMDESDPRPNGAESQTFSAPQRRSTALRPGHKIAPGDTHHHKLNPSNLASKPAQTKYSTVKIKPGRAHDHDMASGLVVPDDHQKGTGIGEQTYAAVVANPVQGEHDESTPLLGNGK